MNPKIRDLMITAGLLVFIALIVRFCTGCNSDFGIPATSTDMELSHSDLAKPATPDMAEQKLDLALTPDLAEVQMVTADLAQNPDLVTIPDLVPDPCAARFRFYSAPPPRLTQVIGTSQNIVGTITVDNITSAMDEYTIHDTIFLEFATVTQLNTPDLQHLKLLQGGQAVTVDLPQCRQNGNSISCALPLVQPIIVRGQLSLDLVADIGLPGQARLGDSFAVYAGAASIRITSKGNDVDFGCIAADWSNAENIIVPFDVIVTGDAPVQGTEVEEVVLNGSQIGRFKITNNGNAKVTITSHRLTDIGTHTGLTTNWWLKYSDQNSTNFTANTAVKSSPNVDFVNVDPFAIDGGAYCFTTTGIADIGKATYGDTFQLEVPKLGSLKYTAAEADIGYDTNLDGKISGNTVALPVDTVGPFPVQLGKISKQ